MPEIRNSIEDIRSKFTESVMRIILILVIVGMPLSLSRIPYTGFVMVHAIQLVLVVVHFVLFLIRRRLSYRTLNIYSILLFLLLSIAGFNQWGLVGGGIYFMMGALFIVSTTQSLRVSTISAIIFLGITALYAHLWVSGALVFPTEIDDYIHKPQSWSTSIIASLTTSALFFVAMTQLVRRLTALSEEVSRQNAVIRELANTDPLTGLPSQRIAEDRLNVAVTQAKRTEDMVGLMFIDFDNFKQINDTYGHDIGDLALKEISHRIKLSIREGDTVSRMGGDEFIVILNHILKPEAELSEISRRILRSASRDIPFEKGSFSTTISIGCSYFPDHGSTFEELRKCADEMMYEVKRSGKDGFRIHP